MAKKTEVAELHRDTCALCSTIVGDGIAPVYCNDKIYCPQCFVWQIIPTEPQRFHAGSYAAVRCRRCDIVSVDAGRRVCNHCHNKAIVHLGPQAV